MEGEGEGDAEVDFLGGEGEREGKVLGAVLAFCISYTRGREGRREEGG